MAPRRPKVLPEAEDGPATAPDDVSITGTRRSTPTTVDGRTPDPAKEEDVALETYEDRVEQAVDETVAGHPDGSAPALERMVDADKRGADD